MSIVDDIDNAIADGVPRAVIRRKIVQFVRDRLHDVDFPLTFVRGQFTIVIEKAEVHRYGLAIWLYVSRQGKSINLDLPIIITRPPLLVEDPTGTIVRTYNNPDEPVTQKTFRIDPLANIVAILQDIIRAAL